MPAGDIWTKAFWKAAGERSISTFAQAAAASAIVINFADVQATISTLEQAAGIGLTASLLSLLKSVGFGFGTGGSPSIVEIPKAKAEEKVETALIEENERQARLAHNSEEN